MMWSAIVKLVEITACRRTVLKRETKTILLLLCTLLFIMSGCGKKKADTHYIPTGTDAGEPTLSEEARREYQYETPEEGDLCADVEILGHGHIYIKLFREEAAYAVDNFVAKAKKDEYDGTLVSDATENYYVQMGQPLTGDIKEESIWGGGFSNEISDKLAVTRGAVCMANQGWDGSNAMQFFFVTGKADVLNSLDAPLAEHYNMTLGEYLKSNYGVSMSDDMLAKYRTYGGAPWLYGRNTVFGQVFKGYDVMDEVCRLRASGEENIYVKNIVIYEYVG